MVSLRNWKHKAVGKFLGKKLFLLGSIHHRNYLPLINELLKTFSPGLILLECVSENDAETGIMHPDMLFAYEFAQKAHIPVRFFDIDLHDTFRDVAKSCSIVDSFILFVFHALSDVVISAPFNWVSAELIAAVKSHDEKEIDFALRMWFPDALSYFRGIVKFKPSDVDRILDSEQLRNYRVLIAKHFSSIYEGLNSASTDVSDSAPFYRIENAAEFFENPGCVVAHMGIREDKMFENIKTAISKNPKSAKILVITGVDHFKFLKTKLGL